MKGGKTMNRFIIVDGLPFLHADGCTYAVRWDKNGFTVGDEVHKASSPVPLYSAKEIKAKCATLDSIGATIKPKATKTRKKASAGDEV